MPASPVRNAIISPSNLFMSVVFLLSVLCSFSLLQSSCFPITLERDFSYSVVGISLFLHRVGKKKCFSHCPGRGKIRGVGEVTACAVGRSIP